MAGPKSIFSLIAGLRASGNGSASTIVPARISIRSKSAKLISGLRSLLELIGDIGLVQAFPWVSKSTLDSASLADVPDQTTNWKAWK